MTNEIFEEFLKDISRCFIERDLAVWRSRLLLPFSIITKSGPTVMASDEEVAENFDHYLVACDAMNLDLIDRHPIALEDCKDGTWLGTFQTRLLSNGVLGAAPYTASSLLHLHQNKMQMSSMLNGRGHTDWTGCLQNKF